MPRETEYAHLSLRVLWALVLATAIAWVSSGSDVGVARYTFNAANDFPCGFYGVDLYSLKSSRQAVIRYLEQVDPEASRRARHWRDLSTRNRALESLFRSQDRGPVRRSHPRGSDACSRAASSYFGGDSR